MKAKKLRFAGNLLQISDQVKLANSSVVEIWDSARISISRHHARKISKQAIALAKALLQKFGQPIPIIVAEDGFIISGVEFYLAAKEMRLPNLNVIRLDNLSEDERRILTLALERLPELSEWDDTLLAHELRDLISLGRDFEVLDHIGFTTGEADARMSIIESDDGADPLDVLPEVQTIPVTRSNDVWLLGTSRVLCGDALLGTNYVALIRKEIAAAIFCDFPYNIAILGNVSPNHQNFQMASGEMSSEQFISFLKTAIGHGCLYLADGGLIYAFMDRRKLGEILKAAAAHNLTIVDLCIWDKGTGGQRRNHDRYSGC